MAVALLFYNMKVDNSLIFALEKKLGEKYEKLFKKDESVVMDYNYVFYHFANYWHNLIISTII